ncbi:phytanoyl-CoA dioxygenase family protein [Apiospora arundinis]|uniref:Phytanoyl-CoA dioxygenase family protein n=1 Tax=Apiospora arundinis TaxID=335852 RepID=A0ABR2IAH2_9PEZI
MSAASRKQPPHPQVTQIELTPDELTSRKVGSHHLQAAVEALHKDGMVVLSNAVDPAHLDKLNERMVPEAKELYSRATTHRNFGNETGNIQQEPVLEDGYIFDDVLANPWATDITQCIRPTSTSTSPSAVPFGYCVNINLVATSAENGATEVWLGSHLNDTTTGVLLETDPDTGHRRIRADLQGRRRNELGCPPVQPSLPKGALVIRDFRLWHAGMPNRTDEPRVMLVSVQFPSWYRSDLKMKLPASIKDKMRWGDLIPCAEWMPEGYDYLKGAHDHDFTLLP